MYPPSLRVRLTHLDKLIGNLISRPTLLALLNKVSSGGRAVMNRKISIDCGKKDYHTRYLVRI